MEIDTLGANNFVGTGHQYQIANFPAVAELINKFIDDANKIGLKLVAEWFSSKPFRKFITSEDFTYDVNPIEFLRTTEGEATLPKNKSIRKFSATAFEASGIDAEHLLHWFEDISQTDTRLYKKIRRMTPAVVIKKANDWITSINGKYDGSLGDVKPILDCGNNLTWYALNDINALKHEGDAMSHCVAADSYILRVNSGQSKVYSLRNNRLKSFLTVEVSKLLTEGLDDKYSLVQIQGKGNRNISISFLQQIISLLNHTQCDDKNQMDNRYNLLYEGGKWQSLIDQWKPKTICGYETLSNGRKAIFFSERKDAIPLLEIAIPREHSENWHINQVTAQQPHYEDQLLICKFLNQLKKCVFHENWCTQVKCPTTGRFLCQPIVLTYEKIYFGETMYYESAKDEYYLPHTLDPARLIAFANQAESRQLFDPRENMSKTEARRCINFLNHLGMNFSFYQDLNQGKLFKNFHKEYDPVYVNNAWHSFALDCETIVPDHGLGTWKVTDYQLQFTSNDPHNHAYIKLNLNRDIVTSAWSSYGLNARYAKTALSFIRKRRLKGDFFESSISFANETKESVFFFGYEDDLCWINSPQRLRLVTHKILNKYKNKIPVKLIVNLISVCNFYIENSRHAPKVVELKNLLMKTWVSLTGDFPGLITNPLMKRDYGLTKYAPSLTKLMTELYDTGFRPTTRAEISNVKRYLKIITQRALGSRRHSYINSDVLDVMLRWYQYAPKRLLNQSSYGLKGTTWIEKYNPIEGFINILNDDDCPHSAFKRDVRDTARRHLENVDFSVLNTSELSKHVELFTLVAADHNHIFCDDLYRAIITVLYQSRHEVKNYNAKITSDLNQLSITFSKSRRNRRGFEARWSD